MHLLPRSFNLLLLMNEQKVELDNFLSSVMGFRRFSGFMALLLG